MGIVAPEDVSRLCPSTNRAPPTLEMPFCSIYQSWHDYVVGNVATGLDNSRWTTTW